MLLRGLLFLLLMVLAGCATAPKGAPPGASPTAAAESAYITRALQAQHHEWAGVPYRLGGMSKRGVDCSGFVQLTFRSQFGLELPRTTGAQASIGRAVSASSLQPGDLVFFRTGRGKNGRHVGIYLQERTFLHASTSRGVTISSLDNPYWSSHYWTARRVDLDRR